MEEQVVSIYSSTPQDDRDSWIRRYELSDIARYESEMLEYVRTSHAGILEDIRNSGKFEEATEQKLIAALDEFANIFQPSKSGGAGEEAA